MKQFTESIVIEAPAQRVWELLTSFDTYPYWNPFIRQVEGIPGQGERLSVTFHAAGRQKAVWRPRVSAFSEPRHLCWQGHTIFPGILDGHLCFTITPLDEHRVRFEHRHTYRGMLAPFYSGILEREMKEGATIMNRALKRWAERSGTGCPRC